MNVKELCLGALTLGDASGYDLKKFFETTFSQFCTAGFGSIYPALADLSAEGLVDCIDKAQCRRPERKLYRLTDAGRRAFLHSLTGASPTHRVKSDFLLVLYFSHLLSAAQLETFVNKRIAVLEQQIDHLKSCPHNAKTTTAGSRLLRGYGLAVMSAARDYLREHRGEINAAAPATRPRQQQYRNAASTATARHA